MLLEAKALEVLNFEPLIANRLVVIVAQGQAKYWQPAIVSPESGEAG
jgi:hypothetical protein